MSDEPEEVAFYLNQPAAEIFAGMLRAEGIPATVSTVSPVPGLVTRASIYVPGSLVEQAKAILEKAESE